MTTLLLSRRHSPDSNLVWKAAVDAGMDVHRLHDLDVKYQGSSGYVVNGITKPYIFYGETLTADAISEALDFYEPTYEWLPNLPLTWRQRHIALTTLQDAYKFQTSMFVKPVDEKTFPAQVYPNRLKLIDMTLGQDPTQQVLVSEPVQFTTEYRFFVSNRHIQTSSPYIRNGMLSTYEDNEQEHTEACDFLWGLLRFSNIEIPPAVVIDVGYIRSRGWAVVEANAAWASGICACEPNQVLETLKNACVSFGSGREEDMKWLRSRHRAY